MLRAFCLEMVDFLFPKDPSAALLETLSPSELLSALPPAPSTNTDTISLFAYGDARVRMLIWELKYRRNARIAASLASILLDVLRQELAERALLEHFSDPLLVPMPMSEARMRERGFNQTRLLCEAMLALDPSLVDYEPDALAKMRHTESQARTHSKRDRLTNVEGSMEIRTPDIIRGRNIILFDDVTTTGATLREARHVLKAAGAKKILCLTLAH